jgi:hypothetical protein
MLLSSSYILLFLFIMTLKFLVLLFTTEVSETITFFYIVIYLGASIV